MLFRCRWCERSYCEDCLDWEKTQLLGDELKEYEMLGFSTVSQAFYIQCPGCAELRIANAEIDALCTSQEQQIDHDYAIWASEAEKVELKGEPQSSVLPSRAESMIDGTTCDDSGLSTPKFNLTDDVLPSARGTKGRKILQLSPPKRPRARARARA